MVYCVYCQSTQYSNLVLANHPFWCIGHSGSHLNNFIRTRLLEVQPLNGLMVYIRHEIDENYVEKIEVAYQDVFACQNRAIAQPFVFNPGSGASVVCTSKVDNTDYINLTTNNPPSLSHEKFHCVLPRN